MEMGKVMVYFNSVTRIMHSVLHRLKNVHFLLLNVLPLATIAQLHLLPYTTLTVHVTQFPSYRICFPSAISACAFWYNENVGTHLRALSCEEIEVVKGLN